ncbi:MAG: hypothetical protein GX561_14165 [Lentisphaerae bacterium]|jgi:biopolymer transport protein ExbD|nr:hypothetical protein [Lentisphaerota bacterium]
MIRWHTKIEYKYGQYPIVAILDCFFILFIIFFINNSVIFWPGTKLETDLNLPVTTVENLQKADKFIVTVTKSGQIFFNDKSLDLVGLETELQEKVLDSNQAAKTENDDDSSEQATIILRADKNITYEKLNRILETAQRLKLGVVLLNDLQQETSAPRVNLRDEQ